MKIPLPLLLPFPSRTRFAERFQMMAPTALTCVLLVGWAVCATVHAAEFGKAFSTPEELASALGQAVNDTNRTALKDLFGPDCDWMVNPDPVQGETEMANFSAAYNATNWLTRKSDKLIVLEVGTNAWPFPIPLVQTNGGWCFDTAAGKEEVINRRIGRNEIEALEDMRAYVEAQREYASRDRDGGEVLKYAQRIASSPGKTDGLYWPTELNGEVSPLGPLYAEAQEEGYFRQATNGPQPFHGYFFKILTQQGSHAPGGEYNYIINGNMIAGFAMVAWPADYGDSGIMTFIVNQQGRVYQKDMGPTTSDLAEDMKAYDPDSSWKVSPD